MGQLGSQTLGATLCPRGKKTAGGGGSTPQGPLRAALLCVPSPAPPGRRAPPPLQQASPLPRLSSCLTPMPNQQQQPPPRIGCHSPDSTTRVPYPSLAHPLPAPPGVRGPARPMSTGAMPRSPPSSPEASSTQAGLGLPSPFTGLHPILGPS